MKDTIDLFDEFKLEKMTTMFSSVKDLVYPDLKEATTTDAFQKTSDGIGIILDKVATKTEKLVENLDKIKSQTQLAQAQAADVEGGGGGLSNELMLQLFTDLQKKIETLNTTMGKVVTALGNTIDVNVKNSNIIGV
jgi:hypothetical protein